MVTELPTNKKGLMLVSSKLTFALKVSQERTGLGSVAFGAKWRPVR